MVKRLGQGVADRFHKTVQVTEGLPDGNQLAALTLHGFILPRPPDKTGVGGRPRSRSKGVSIDDYSTFRATRFAEPV